MLFGIDFWKGSRYSSNCSRLKYGRNQAAVGDIMQTEAVKVYTKEYSEIEGFQHADSVQYALCRQGEILRLSIGASVCKLAGISEEYAARLLLFLYENAVLPEHLTGIVQDLCSNLTVE